MSLFSALRSYYGKGGEEKLYDVKTLNYTVFKALNHRKTNSRELTGTTRELYLKTQQLEGRIVTSDNLTHVIDGAISITIPTQIFADRAME